MVAEQMAPLEAPQVQAEQSRVSAATVVKKTCFAEKSPGGHATSPACWMHRPDRNGAPLLGAHTAPFEQPVPAVVAPPHARPSVPQLDGGTVAVPPLDVHVPPVTVGAGLETETLQGELPAAQLLPAPAPQVEELGKTSGPVQAPLAAGAASAAAQTGVAPQAASATVTGPGTQASPAGEPHVHGAQVAAGALSVALPT
jgi:hypothetical protein